MNAKPNHMMPAKSTTKAQDDAWDVIKRSFPSFTRMAQEKSDKESKTKSTSTSSSSKRIKNTPKIKNMIYKRVDKSPEEKWHSHKMLYNCLFTYN